ncbi:MAG: hypothetical protein RLZZ244_597 [Verrucomicrobiota bacterium]|jgi:NDP-sugar pyrophosphorylase family protein
MRACPSQAFVLGAGLGTRLKSLTARLPKPLIPVCNEPLITRVFAHLRGNGVERFIINTHWRAEAYARAFPDAQWADCPLAFSHEFPEVLETAGGLKQAEPLLRSGEGGAFWVYNGDILSDLPLERAWEAHCAAGNEVTLVLRSKDGPLQVGWDAATGLVTDLGRRLHPEREPGFLFTGIYVVEPAFLQRIPPAAKLGVVPVFLEMIRRQARLGGVVVDEGCWWDLGSREQYLAVHRELARTTHGAPWVHPGAVLGPGAQLRGACAIGFGARVGEGAVLEDTVVWAGASVEPGAILNRCIVTENAVVSGFHEDVDLS